MTEKSVQTWSPQWSKCLYSWQGFDESCWKWLTFLSLMYFCFSTLLSLHVRMMSSHHVASASYSLQALYGSVWLSEANKVTLVLIYACFFFVFFSFFILKCCRITFREESHGTQWNLFTAEISTCQSSKAQVELVPLTFRRADFRALALCTLARWQGLLRHLMDWSYC